MKNSLKRLLCLLLTLVMMVSALPVGAMAHSEPEAAATPNKLFDIPTEYYVNPLLEGKVDPEELFAKARPSISTTAEYPERANMDAAAADLRQALRNRTEDVVVVFRSTTSPENFHPLQVLSKALAHTGNPQEGDYLAWNLLGRGYGGGYYIGDGYYLYRVSFGFIFGASAAQEATVTSAVEELLSALNLEGESDYKKVKGIYDWMCANITYDYDNLADDTYLLKHSAYAALIDRTAVCQGYALLFYRLILELGVDCRVVCSSDHAWNIVKLGDYYYNLDSTWDAGMAQYGYRYFLKSDASFKLNAQGSHDRSDDSWYLGEGFDFTSSEFYAKYPMSPTDYQPSETPHTHSDADGDGNHKCDTCGADNVTPHVGGTATCMAKAVCTECGASYGEKNPNNHTGVNHIEGAVAATCTQEGYTGDTYCQCGVRIATGSVIGKKDHNYQDGKCADCGTPDPNAPTEPEPTEPKPTEPEPTEPEPTEPSEPEVPELDGVIRLSGANRYETGFAIADQLKVTLGVNKFQAVVVAYGQNFPDALTGSYLAAVKKAPILLTEKSVDHKVATYISDNLVSGGTVYILGGGAAVSESFESAMFSRGFRVIRLKGAGRYETNLAILEEAGVNRNDEVLIATGTNYADSLSASATGLPMLLVGDKLTDAQVAFLVSTSRRFVILGGTGAVSEAVEAELDAIGDVIRVKGASRYGTSVAIARRYFTNPRAAVLAYAQGFPDGLCGGPLAIAMGAPLILTSNESSWDADDYVYGIHAGAVTGGSGRISDDTVRNIFDLPRDAQIVKP